jgi:hypothetical protein
MIEFFKVVVLFELLSSSVSEASFHRAAHSTRCLFGLLFGPEDGGSIYLRKVGEHGFIFFNSP